MAIFRFLGDIEYRCSDLMDFWSLKDHDIPRSPGVYILASQSTHFHYPEGKSPIFYIGQSQSLHSRLGRHLELSNQARGHTEATRLLYRPRYEYAAAFNARYCYIRTWQNVSPKALEEIVLTRFAKKYYSFPVANGAGTWSRVDKEFKNMA